MYRKFICTHIFIHIHTHIQNAFKEETKNHPKFDDLGTKTVDLEFLHFL